VDDYATPNANNPSSDLQLCKMEINATPGHLQINISYNNDGRISTITNFWDDGGGIIQERTFNITYNQNKIIISSYDIFESNHEYIFNNELHSYSAETINNQVFHCFSMFGFGAR
jgi:hypothetical protein